MGPQGSAVPRGPATGVLWADANGAQVSGLSGNLRSIAGGNNLEYGDAAGNIWDLDPDALTMAVMAPDLMYRTFTTTNCTGTAYYTMNRGGTMILPRVTFGVQGHAGVRVRNDTAAVMMVSQCSVETDASGTCQGSLSCQSVKGILESDTTIVTPPTPTIARPIRPVLMGQ